MGIALIFFKVGAIFLPRRFGSPAAFTFLENVHPDLSLLKPGILVQKKVENNCEFILPYKNNVLSLHRNQKTKRDET